MIILTLEQKVDAVTKLDSQNGCKGDWTKYKEGSKIKFEKGILERPGKVGPLDKVRGI